MVSKYENGETVTVLGLLIVCAVRTEAQHSSVGNILNDAIGSCLFIMMVTQLSITSEWDN